MSKEDEENTNNTVDDRERRKKNLSCSYCKPNKGENASRKSKHGAKKPKRKDKRK